MEKEHVLASLLSVLGHLNSTLQQLAGKRGSEDSKMAGGVRGKKSKSSASPALPLTCRGSLRRLLLSGPQLLTGTKKVGLSDL